MTADELQTRLVVIRRLYLYTAAFVSLFTVHVNLRVLVRETTYVWIDLSGEWIGSTFYYSPIANASMYGASLLVALLFFVLHWKLIQRFLVRDDTEEQSNLRHTFMWACLLLSIYWFCAGLAEFLNVPLQNLTGSTVVPTRVALLYLSPLTFQLAVAALCVDRFARICIFERHTGRNYNVQSIAAIFQVVVQFTSLFLVVRYLRRLAYAFSRIITEQISWSEYSTDFATLLSALAILIWLHHMGRTLRNNTQNTLSAALHIGYLQAGMLLGIVVALVNLYDFHDSSASLSLRSILSSNNFHWRRQDVSEDLAVLTLGLICWQFHAWLSHRSLEHKRAADWGRALPRFRNYLLALVGLVLLCFEVFSILHEDILPGLHRGISFMEATRQFWHSAFDSGEILVSVPLLVATWLTVARHERLRLLSALEVMPRRIYAYLVCLVSGLILMLQGGFVLHALMLAWSTGEPVVGREVEIARSVLAGIVLGLHLVMLRRGEDRIALGSSDDRTRILPDNETAGVDEEVEQPANRLHSWMSDRFALILSMLIGTLLVAVLISVLPSRTRAGTHGVLEYRTDNTPKAVVHNGYLALEQNDMDRYKQLFTEERWEVLSRGGGTLYGHVEKGNIGIKVGGATGTGTKAVVNVSTIHTNSTLPPHGSKIGFLAIRMFRPERWKVDVEQVDGKWMLALRLPESKH